MLLSQDFLLIQFISLGAFLSVRKMDLVETLKRYELPAYIVSAALAITMVCTYHMPSFSSLMLVFRITGAIAVFCLASHISQKGHSPLCDSAYFIYLAHYVFFMSFVDEAFFSIFDTSMASLSVHYLLCPLIKVAIFVGIYTAYQWTKSKLIPTDR